MKHYAAAGNSNKNEGKRKSTNAQKHTKNVKTAYRSIYYRNIQATEFASTHKKPRKKQNTHTKSNSQSQKIRTRATQTHAPKMAHSLL